MGQVILEAKGLVKSYLNGQSKLIVLNGIDLSLEEGKIITIMGKSGSGKSTLLNILSTLDSSDRGSLKINGDNIRNFSDNDISSLRNYYIGFVFQFHHLLPDFTVFENILMPKWINKKKFKLEWALELLDILELKKNRDQYPSELSGGERQRVAVLRALINKPKILFADEPTGNLDEKNALILVDLFRKINRDFGVTIVLTTHNSDVASIGNVKYELKSALLEEK
jgi:ABC-type lipoprotein export system ATPase subunit|tara:strand:+ start:2764 stop:3438 length:675 start_codon:yes stop_codon:yes gene_type:complete